MHSDMIGKIEKARRYAQEPERVEIVELRANFRGNNGDHVVTLKDGQWSRNDSLFHNHGTVYPQVMAMQRILGLMLCADARQLEPETGVPMHSDMIGKIEKARLYAQEPERIQITELKANFRGSNGHHVVMLKDGHWSCDCSFFRNWGTCPHIMAMQRLLERMLAPEARQPEMIAGAYNETVSL